MDIYNKPEASNSNSFMWKISNLLATTESVLKGPVKGLSAHTMYIIAHTIPREFNSIINKDALSKIRTEQHGNKKAIINDSERQFQY